MATHLLPDEVQDSLYTSRDPEKAELARVRSTLDPLTPSSASSNRDTCENRAHLVASPSISIPLFTGTPTAIVLHERGQKFCSEAWPAFLLGLVVTGFCFPAFCVYMSLFGKWEDGFPGFLVLQLSVLGLIAGGCGCACGFGYCVCEEGVGWGFAGLTVFGVGVLCCFMRLSLAW